MTWKRGTDVGLDGYVRVVLFPDVCDEGCLGNAGDDSQWFEHRLSCLSRHSLPWWKCEMMSCVLVEALEVTFYI